MPSTLSPDNPIAWAQVRLRGGWKNLLIVAGMYALLVGAGILVTAQLMTTSPSTAYGNWLPGLLGLQVAVLLLFGTGRVTAAVRADHASRMIESHRLMPIGGASAVVGYVAGSTCQATALAAVNLVLGLFVSTGAGFPIGSWLTVNVVLGLFCAFVWVVAAFWAFLVKMPFLVLFLPLLVIWFSGGLLIAAVPGLILLVSPLVGNTVFGLRASAVELTPARGVSILAQAFVATLCFIGAGRRFRRGDAPAFTLPMGLLLLAGWVVISCTAVAWWDDFRPTFLPRRWVGLGGQFVGSLLSAMLVALAPVAGLARAEREWRQRVPDDPRPPRRPIPGALLAALATLITTALVWVVGTGGDVGNFIGGAYDPDAPRRVPWGELLDPTLRTAAIVFLFLLGSGYLLRILGSAGVRPAALFFIWLMLTWVGPLLVDAARYALRDEHGGPVLGELSTAGAPGALVQLWSPPEGFGREAPAETLRGIAAQGLLTGMLAFFYYSRRNKRKAVG